MDFLREEVENLKKLGQSWEMEKYEIEEAIMKAIAGIYFKTELKIKSLKLRRCLIYRFVFF